MESEDFHDCVEAPPCNTSNGDEEIINCDCEINVEKSLELSESYKSIGNDQFKERDYEGCITDYTKAILHCPEDGSCDEHLSVCYGNRAAAYVALGEFETALEDCCSALQINENYTKVLNRRSQCYEKLDRLEESLQDLKKIKEIDPSFPKIHENILRLEKLNAEKLENLKNEALGKLKDLGNSILGNFGLSLDNFKMQQDPATGSWSVSMNNK